MQGSQIKQTVLTLMLVALLVGCDGPFLMIPGGKLSGTVETTPVDDWSFLSEDFVHLEANPADPYSVELNYIVKDGKLYIDPKEGRGWFEELKKDDKVRVRFGTTIYPVTAVLVGQPGELPGFDADRHIYRLDYRVE